MNRSRRDDGLGDAKEPADANHRKNERVVFLILREDGRMADGEEKGKKGSLLDWRVPGNQASFA
jgi:hypothetical protein